MTESLQKFQVLLRELFQFDCADLDFGIYRIMNHKRGAIERFISTDLPKAVAEELDRGALAEQSQAAAELKEVAAQIKETLGSDALDADGRLAEAYHTTPLGKKYLSLKAKAAGGRGREALEASIFNRLYAFFSRYYQDGDFISKRRYSKRQRYAIPYNGEEVYLYWANNDQYYVKTAEHFHDYTFASRGVTVHFKLQAASVEQNNVKGDKRFFLPRAKETAWDEKASQLVIPFEYRPLTEQEEISYGKKNQQEAIIAEALTEIPKCLKKADRALVALTTERHKTGDGKSVTFLEHHLRQYTRRNTSDFFLHKDLKGFLARELDFYLKNEVLNLDEMKAAGEERAEGWFQITRAIKAVGGRIIDFLEQIESFQKMLWEKRKFITETQYCITIGNIDESFYPDVAACEPQWAEWKELFHIDEEETNLFNSGKDKKGKRIAFLKSHPTLVLDTKHFDAGFVDKLLAIVDDLDGKTDGLLFHSENFQALSLLQESLRGAVQCVYGDPPYNKGNDFAYKDCYQHSSWLAMQWDRTALTRSLMTKTGIQWISLDDHEAENYHRLLRQSGLFGETKLLTAITNLKGIYDADGFVATHEYVVCATVESLKTVGELPVQQEVLESEWKEDDYGPYKQGDGLRRTGADASRERRPNGWFPVFVTPAGEIYVTQDDEPFSDKDTAVYPLDTDGNEMSWSWGKGKITSETHNLILKGDPNNGYSIYKKQRASIGDIPTRKVKSFLYKPEYSSTHGGNLAKDLFNRRMSEFTPKSVALLSDLIKLAHSESGRIVDAYAGSGTSGHAVINLNREDEGRRKFILVEMGQYFDTVLLPRIKKITFTPEWKNGKPKRMATQEEAERSPRIVKYMRVESYEDALNNIAFDDSSGQQALGFEDYLLQYMLKWETRASETLLNVENLARPFSYKLHIHADGQTREKIANVPETFNYLLGLHVQTRQVYEDDGRRYLVYRGRVDHRQVVVIWRETDGWTKEDLERDKRFVAEQKLTEGADEVFVNGDSFIPDAKALEPVFKARMFASVEI